ncbi:MAG: helix-turn-helix transcriptional regulator [Lachnospiraceae bacterium]|nr:helix-turn-helix transcriptional regulator [Lachnospiraceae bacterium]
MFRKKKGMTQEGLAETLKVSRQSVSRWEMGAAFPETDKLIKLSKLFDCSIDFLLNDSMQEGGQNDTELSIKNCYKFICECGSFFGNIGG